MFDSETKILILRFMVILLNHVIGLDQRSRSENLIEKINEVIHRET